MDGYGACVCVYVFEMKRPYTICHKLVHPHTTPIHPPHLPHTPPPHTSPTQNVIEYCGGAEDRAVIREYEWWFTNDRRRVLPRFHVLLTSYELLNRELTYFKA